MIDDLGDGVETLLNGKVVLVVDGAQEVGGLLGGDQVGSAGETNGKRVESGPRGEGRVLSWKGSVSSGKRFEHSEDI